MGQQEAFKSGDTVQLKSGGPVMTVSHIEGKSVWCKWFGGAKFEVEHFYPDMLKASTLYGWWCS